MTATITPTWESWLAAILDDPADMTRRAAFLDWMQEQDGERYGPASPWFRDFLNEPGAWAVEARQMPAEIGGPDAWRWWTVLLWLSGGCAIGTGMVDDVRLPVCTNCRVKNPGPHGRYFARPDGEWVCEACAEREGLPPDGLSGGPVHIENGGLFAAVGDYWSDIPF